MFTLFFPSLLVSLCCSLFLEGMTVNGITNINLTTLEKRFQLTSKEMGFIAASNDISGIILISFISFYGTYGDKPKWLGFGSLCTGNYMSYIDYKLIYNFIK